jgi:hypothetical protein
MFQNVSKRGKYGDWKAYMMEQAYRNGDTDLNAASRTYNDPKATLKRRVDGGNINVVNHVQAFGRSIDLPKETEDELSKHVLHLEERFFGLTRNDLRRLLFPVAEANKLPHCFIREQKIAGDKWYYGTIPRHPEIPLRQPEPTSMARTGDFNKERVREFFEVLGNIVDSYELDATSILTWMILLCLLSRNHRF